MPVFAWHLDAEERILQIYAREPRMSSYCITQVLKLRQGPVEILSDFIGWCTVHTDSDPPILLGYKDKVVAPWQGLCRFRDFLLEPSLRLRFNLGSLDWCEYAPPWSQGFPSQARDPHVVAAIPD